MEFDEEFVNLCRRVLLNALNKESELIPERVQDLMTIFKLVSESVDDNGALVSYELFEPTSIHGVVKIIGTHISIIDTEKFSTALLMSTNTCAYYANGTAFVELLVGNIARRK